MLKLRFTPVGASVGACAGLIVVLPRVAGCSHHGPLDGHRQSLGPGQQPVGGSSSLGSGRRAGGGHCPHRQHRHCCGRCWSSWCSLVRAWAHSAVRGYYPSSSLYRYLCRYPDACTAVEIRYYGRKFRTTTKILIEASKLTKLPLVAIGGINSNNYKNLLLNKANFLAISGYVWNNKKYKPQDAIKKLV